MHRQSQCHAWHGPESRSIKRARFICALILLISSHAWTPSNGNVRRCLEANRQSDRRIHVLPFVRQKGSLYSQSSKLGPKAVSSESETAENEIQSTTDEKESPETFTSTTMQVFIEDTDAFGMKYNGNYIRTYERALHAAELGKDSILSQHPDAWTMIKVTNQKFKATIPLGGNYVISGILEERSSDSEVWNLCMSCPENDGMVYNSATVTVGMPPSRNEDTELPKDERIGEGANTTVHHDMLHRDEFDPHHPNHLPLRSVLNLCERSRSNYIGGPDALSRVQNQGVLIVVTGIDDLLSYPQHSYPKQRVRVVTHFCPKRRGLLCQAQHYLFDDETNKPIAQAFVTMVAMNATSKRPTQWPFWS